MDARDGQVRCLRCGRVLRAEASVAAGYGRGCRARIRATAKAAPAVLTGYTPAQLGQAAELIADAAVIPTSRPTVFRTVATDGTAVYLTSVNGCTCPASKQCYHRAAVTILAAA
jgi:Family of unknown function (DUF6011)